MAINSTSNLTAEMATYYDKVFMDMSVQKCNYYQAAQHKNLPLNEGKTVNFTRYMPLATRTTALTETTTGGIAEGSGKTLVENTVSATVAPYGDFTEIHEMVRLTSIDKNLVAKVEVIGVQAKETIDELMWRQYGDNCLRLRADSDATYQLDSVTDGAGSTTTIVDSVLTQTDDYWNGGYVTITDRNNAAYGETRAATDFANSGAIVTVDAAFSTAPGTACDYHISISTGLANTNAADNLTHLNIARAKRELDVRHALPFKNGMFCGLMDPRNEFDFFGADTTLTGLAQQSRPSMLLDGVIGRWMGIEWKAQSVGWAHAVGTDQTYVATGAATVVPVFGREAIGAVDLAGQQQKVHMRSWKDLGQEIPNHSTIGWEIIFAQKVLNSCWAVGLVTTPDA